MFGSQPSPAKTDGPVGEDRADDEFGSVALDQFPGLVGRDVGLQLVVCGYDFRIEPAELAAHVLDRQHEAVAPLFAEHGAGAGERQHQADRQLVLCAVLSGSLAGQQRRGQEAEGQSMEPLAVESCHRCLASQARGAANRPISPERCRA